MLSSKNFPQKFVMLTALLTVGAACRQASWEFVGKKSTPPATIIDPAPVPTPSNTPAPGSEVPAPVPVAPPQAAFAIKAVPNPATVGAGIAFTGDCGGECKGKITWTMGNGDSREGNPVTYAYYREGTYTVTATWDDGSGTPKIATVAVVITPFNPGPGQNGGQNGSQSGGQNGNQNPTQNKK